MCTSYICLAWKQYHNIIIANPCIRNCDNMNCNIWKLVRVINILTFCYSLYKRNFISHFFHVEKQRKSIKKKKNKGGKKWCSTFPSKIMWSGWWVVITTGGYLCARIFVSKASNGVLLFVVYHQADGGYYYK